MYPAKTYASAAAAQDGAGDAEKIHDYRDGVGRSTHVFIPLASKTFRHLGKPAMQVLTRLVRMAVE